jgi:hypothetical protein
MGRCWHTGGLDWIVAFRSAKVAVVVRCFQKTRFCFALLSRSERRLCWPMNGYDEMGKTTDDDEPDAAEPR